MYITHAHIHTRTHAHTYTHIHIHTHTYTHTCTGLLQGTGKGSSAEATSYCESKVLQPYGREEDQGSGRGLCAGGVVELSVYLLLMFLYNNVKSFVDQI